jgi:DNA-binding transcriptional LysR family regulator
MMTSTYGLGVQTFPALAAIADGQMDLALGSIQSSPSPLVALRELTREPMVFVCDTSRPQSDGARVRLVDLGGEDLIKFPVGWGIRQRVDAALAAAGVNPIGAYEVADYAIAAELVRHGSHRPRTVPDEPLVSLPGHVQGRPRRAQ